MVLSCLCAYTLVAVLMSSTGHGAVASDTDLCQKEQSDSLALKQAIRRQRESCAMYDHEVAMGELADFRDFTIARNEFESSCWLNILQLETSYSSDEVWKGKVLLTEKVGLLRQQRAEDLCRFEQRLDRAVTEFIQGKEWDLVALQSELEASNAREEQRLRQKIIEQVESLKLVQVSARRELDDFYDAAIARNNSEIESLERDIAKATDASERLNEGLHSLRQEIKTLSSPFEELLERKSTLSKHSDMRSRGRQAHFNFVHANKVLKAKSEKLQLEIRKYTELVNEASAKGTPP